MGKSWKIFLPWFHLELSHHALALKHAVKIKFSLSDLGGCSLPSCVGHAAQSTIAQLRISAAYLTTLRASKLHVRGSGSGKGMLYRTCRGPAGK